MRDKKTGYDLMREAAQLVAMLEESEGVLDEQSEAQLERWFEQFEDKIGAYWAVVKRLRSEAQFLKDEKGRIAKRQKALETHEKAINQRAFDLLKSEEAKSGERKIKKPEFTASLTTRKATVITDEEALLAVPEFRAEEVKVDKTALNLALKAGREIDGAKLESVEGISWR